MSIVRFRKRHRTTAPEATPLRTLEQLARLRNILDHIDPDGLSSPQIAALACAEGYPTTADRVMAIHRADFAAVQDITPAEVDAIDWATARLALSQAVEAYNPNVNDILPAKIMDIYPRPDLSTPDGMRNFAQTLPNIAACVALADEIEQRHKSNGSDILR
jgi:hypothetical protein